MGLFDLFKPKVTAEKCGMSLAMLVAHGVRDLAQADNPSLESDSPWPVPDTERFALESLFLNAVAVDFSTNLAIKNEIVRSQVLGTFWDQIRQLTSDLGATFGGATDAVLDSRCRTYAAAIRGSSEDDRARAIGDAFAQCCETPENPMIAADGWIQFSEKLVAAAQFLSQFRVRG